MVMRERPLKRDHNWQNYENTDGDRPGYEKENIGGEDEGGKPEARRRGGCLCFEFLVLVSNHSAVGDADGGEDDGTHHA